MATTYFDKFNRPVRLIGSNIEMERIGSSTYSTVQHWRNNMASAGVIGTGGVITDAGSNTINVSAGQCAIRPTTSHTSTLYFADFAAGVGLSVPSNATRYVGIEYNSGTPIVAVRSTNDFDYMTNFPIGVAVNEAGTIHVITANRHEITDSASHMAERLERTEEWSRDEFIKGIEITETGTRNIVLSTGKLWCKLINFTIDAINTSTTGSFDTYYRDGSGGFTKATGVTQWPNTQYDDGSGTLVTMTNNKYANLWWYVEPDDGDLIMVYGQAQHTSVADAEAEDPPTTIAARIARGARIITRLTFQKSAATAESIRSAFTSIFALSTGGITDHAALSNLSYAAAGHTGFQEAIVIQSLGVKNADFTVDVASGSYAKVTTGSAAMNMTLTNGTSATIGQRLDIEITQGATPRVVTYKAADANVISSGGLLSSGDALPNSGASTVDIFSHIWNGADWVVVNALFDVRA